MDGIFHVSFPGLGIDQVTIDRVAVDLFGFEIYWYGIIIAFAILLCLFLVNRSAKRYGVLPDYVLDTILAIIPLMLVFARIYYVAFSWDEFKGNWLGIFNPRTGGLAFYGGVIGGAVAIVLVSKIRRVPLSRMMDLLVVYLPLGQAIGRWGNFFNQEAFGTNTTLPWGMISEGTTKYLKEIGGFDPLAPVHPTFLYEFLANLLIFALLLWVRKKSKRPFETTVVYFIAYGSVRFFTESIRTDSLYIGSTGIRISMVLSAAMFLIALVLFILIRRKPVIEGLAGVVADTKENDIAENPGK
jgi:phosphatidylglycerol:prolipoprotein diacylglycerol transferase